jgi:superfamily II DNA or RNA helicase
MIKLVKHQKDAVKNTIKQIKGGLGSTVGRIVIPTGGGKTFVEAAILDFQRKQNPKTRIHVVLAPRIVLCNQLIDEYRKFLGYSFRALAFHSGHHEPEDENIDWAEQNTTSIEVVKKYHKDAQKSGVDLVVFSTYHSCDKLSGIDFDTMIADESQYCVAENFGENVKKISARVKLFFTATEKFTASSKGRGLNNESLYGKRFYYIAPHILIKRGIIIPPRLHVMHGVVVGDKKQSLVDQVIQIGSAQHQLTVKKLKFSKILFAMKGTDDVKTVLDNIKKIKEALPDHDIYTITSKQGAQINGQEVNRETEFMPTLKTTTKSCLIFHYDILSEGIDIDGITGVVLMRNLGLAKLLQTIGRAVRVYKPNPKLKPQAWISVPVLNGDEDDKERLKQIVTHMRLGGHNISKEDIVEFPGEERHEKDEDPMKDAYKKKKKNVGSKIVDDVLHRIEKEDFWLQVSAAKTMKQKIDVLFEEVL